MGSWSVSCGISNIAITSGNPCVIIPLKKSKGLSYQKYQPATLPIFGVYNDYGGMENIEVNSNTKFIEEHFGVTIDEFVEFLVDGKHTYERNEAKDIKKRINDVDNIEEMRFMWVDRQVYDFMTIFQDTWYKGHGDFGTPEFMELFGFTLDKDTIPEGKDNYDPKRFKYVYRKGDVMMYSDGKTLLAPGRSYVYDFGKGGQSSIETYFDVPEELHYLKELGEHEMWRLMSHGWFRDKMAYLMADRYTFENSTLEYLLEKMNANLSQEDIAYDKRIRERNLSRIKEIGPKYFLDIDTFGDDIVKLYNFYGNFHPMSAQFMPHTLYLTPQCGEHRQHQKMLEKFCEINRSYCQFEDE